MENDGEKITQALVSAKNAEEKFARIQENPALYGAENGLTAEELEMLEKPIANCGEAALAGDAIARRCSGN